MDWFNSLIEPLPVDLQTFICIACIIVLALLIILVTIGLFLAFIKLYDIYSSPKMWCYINGTRKRVKFPHDNISFYDVMLNKDKIEVKVLKESRMYFLPSLLNRLASYPYWKVEVTEDISLLSILKFEGKYLILRKDDCWVISKYGPEQTKKKYYKYYVIRAKNPSHCEKLLSENYI